VNPYAPTAARLKVLLGAAPLFRLRRKTLFFCGMGALVPTDPFTATGTFPRSLPRKRLYLSIVSQQYFGPRVFPPSPVMFVFLVGKTRLSSACLNCFPPPPLQIGLGSHFSQNFLLLVFSLVGTVHSFADLLFASFFFWARVGFFSP